MTVKNIFIWGTHLCANAALKFDYRQLLVFLAGRIADRDVGAIPAWIDVLYKECQKGSGFVLKKVRQRGSGVPGNWKLDGDSVWFPFSCCEIPLGLKDRTSSCLQIFETHHANHPAPRISLHG